MTQGLHADNVVKLCHDAKKIEMFQLAKSLRCNAFGVSTPKDISQFPGGKTSHAKIKDREKNVFMNNTEN